MSVSPVRKDLSSLNTMALPCVAEQFYHLPDDEAVSRFFSETLECAGVQDDVLILGGGSNVLLPESIPQMVVQLGHSDLAVCDESAEHVTVRVGAAVVWDQLVAWSVEQGFYGLENLSLIPGSVGAAPVQNIGAYGVELKDVLISVRAFDRRSQSFISLTKHDCQFAYRDSIFKREAGRFVITELMLTLSKSPSLVLGYGELKALKKDASESGLPSLKTVRETVIAVRSAKLPDPKLIPNTGSFFKNPILSASEYQALKEQFPTIPAYPQADGAVKVAAGWMIEQAGLKGYQLGAARVHDKQALVLTNAGGANQHDILRLAAYVKEKVQLRYGVRLEQEPVIISTAT